MRCRVVVASKNDECGKEPATHVVMFGDGDKVAACLPCALHLKQTAEAHGTNVKVEALR